MGKLKEIRMNKFMLNKGEEIANKKFKSIIIACEICESEKNELFYYHYLMVDNYKILRMLGIASLDGSYAHIYSDKYSTNDLVDKVTLENNKVKILDYEELKHITIL